MSHPIPYLKTFIVQIPTIGLVKSIATSIFLIFWMNSINLLAAQPQGVDAVFDNASGSSSQFVVWFTIGIIMLSVLTVTALTWWSNKQDDINNMMTFCIKYLMETRNEAQKNEATKALGHIKDPGALLILVDIINNEAEERNLRKTAGEALLELSLIYRKYEGVIKELLIAVEEKGHQKTIEILISNFENREKTYVQSAFVIGREFMRLKQYADARDWLQKAKIRNNKTVVYVDQISALIDICNEKLFFEGDILFQMGDYFKALERYALASHDLRYTEKQRFVSHLRLACVYCKLTHYKDAYQETLHALHDRHKTDISLHLNKLLKRQQGEMSDPLEVEEKGKKILDDIDKYVTDVMVELSDMRSLDQESLDYLHLSSSSSRRL